MIQFSIATYLPAASPSPLSRYKTVYRDTIHQPVPAHGFYWPCSGFPWPCRGLYRGPAGCIVADNAHPCCALRPVSQALCHDTNYCIVTQCMLKMGSSPAAACNVFFFHHFSSSHSSHWKTIKEFFFFFSFSSKPNKFLKLYFIYFSSSFTHCKTLKNFLLIVFFHLQ